MKKLTIIFGVVSLLLGAASIARAAEEKSDWSVVGSVALSSEYNFRGLTLSARQPALQHSVTASHKSGGYFGYWASNVNGQKRSSTKTQQQALEIDLYAGLYYEVNENFYVDLLGLFYTYNFIGATSNDANELNANSVSGNLNYQEYFVTLGFLGGKLKLIGAYSPEFFGFGALGESSYLQVAYDGQVADNFKIRASVGSTNISNKIYKNISSLIDYKLAFVANWNDGADEAEFAFIGVDKNAKDFYLNDFGYERSFYEDRLQFTLKKGF
ncbi:MAG: TorF family putative porin [Methylacidiphilales bacterium]|nr:TorF family putative porin [Candidatus Methylacidiphilales bacterium]